MSDAFFQPKFSIRAKYLAQKIYNVHAISRQFSDIINGGQSQQPSVLCQLVTGESQRTGICSPKES